MNKRLHRIGCQRLSDSSQLSHVIEAAPDHWFDMLGESQLVIKDHTQAGDLSDNKQWYCLKVNSWGQGWGQGQRLRGQGRGWGQTVWPRGFNISDKVRSLWTNVLQLVFISLLLTIFLSDCSLLVMFLCKQIHYDYDYDCDYDTRYSHSYNEIRIGTRMRSAAIYRMVPFPMTLNDV